MQASFNDGLTARSAPVELIVEGERLTFDADGQAHVWSLADLQIEDLGERLRLSHPKIGDGRLTVDAAAWRASVGGVRAERRHRSRETRLVVGLAVAGLAIAAVVFIGVPAASGPLARATPPDIEKRMGRNFEGQLSLGFRRCNGEAGQTALATFGHRLQDAADTPFDIRVRAVQAPMANAFALPGGAVMVTDDLIDMAKTPDELSAVIAHEAAHVERRHVMQAVWRSWASAWCWTLLWAAAAGPDSRPCCWRARWPTYGSAAAPNARPTSAASNCWKRAACRPRAWRPSSSASPPRVMDPTPRP
uniref:M48 family metalloprotease n=1 Tax=Phenylobacterium glaciei TaxID=2803784 RepID=A0A974S8N8_9CAUL|nr:M48 family metalloprotease [Phenylobacterium glaciei]